MTTTKLALISMVLTLIGEGGPGWLAQALARTDPDVDAAVAAYEAGDWELATEHLDAAVERRGDRPELYYDRGLVLLAQADKEGAREAFQRGTESDVPGVLASSHYQLGNLAMMDEDWEAAIAEYIGCLRAQPDHQNAKWNLEIALQRKREQEKKEQDQEKQDQEKQDQEKQDQENQDQEKQDQEKQDQEKQDQEKQDQEKQDQENQDQEKQDQEKQDQEKQDPQKQDQEKQDPQKQDQEKQDQQEPAEPEQAEAKPIETGDLDAALEQLDRQDEFMLGRPRGSRRPVEKDW
ncbi:hypothetical protein ACNOYE_16125 [Nannocystaceae bacterium ST9]